MFVNIFDLHLKRDILLNMNTLRHIREKYKFVNTELAKVLCVHKNSINTLLDRDLDTFSIKQLCNLREYTQSTFNELLGETVFTPENIDNQTDKAIHTNLSNDLITINENEIHLHPSFVEAIRQAIQNDKE